jgi:uncharacterized protein (DUF2147 family)
MSLTLKQYPLGRALALGFTLAFAVAGAASAASPVGEWLVAEKTARVKIADCAGVLWGIVSWEADPGRDSHNPDPSKRNQPITGLPILMGLKPSGGERWDGSLYNADNGKSYSGGVTLVEPDILRVRGCVLFILCGGENWTRTQGGSAPSDNSDVCVHVTSAPSSK